MKALGRLGPPFVLVVAAACAGTPGPAAQPPPTVDLVAPPALPPAVAVAVNVVEASAPSPFDAADAGPALAPPLMAKFLTVTPAGVHVPYASACDVVLLAVARGSIGVAGQTLAVGDSARIRHAPHGAIDVTGRGLVLAATVTHECPSVDAPAARELEIKVARAGDAKELTWAGGAMHAHLDLEPAASPDVYLGRLDGTAKVAEHDHPTSWEILCAYEGAGTFEIDGAPTHLVAPFVVAVPPGRKHAWRPDAGVRLVALQIYDPPGPEQRFKALAAR